MKTAIGDNSLGWYSIEKTVTDNVTGQEEGE